MALPNITITETTPGTLTVTWTQDPLAGNSTTLTDGAELCLLHFIADGPSTCDFATPVVLFANPSQETVSYTDNNIRNTDFINGSLSFCDPLLVLIASGGTLTDGTPSGGGSD
jgi:hypothetical protein